MSLRLSTVTLVSLCALLGGCATLGQGPVKSTGTQAIDQANAKIAAVQATEAKDIAGLQTQIATQRKAETSVVNQQIQQASDHVYLAEITYQLDPSPSSFESLMNAEAQSAATTLFPPDTATVASGIAKMRGILADKDKEAQALAAEVSAAQAKAAQLTSQKTAAEQQIVSIQAQETQIKQADSQQIAQIQAAKDTATKSAFAKDQELLSNKAFTDDVKRKLTIGAGILAVLAIAAAVFSPLLKRQFAELAGVLAFVAVSIIYVTPQIVGIVFAVGLIAVLISIFCEHKDAVAATVSSATPAPAPVTVAQVSTQPVGGFTISAPITSTTVIPSIAATPKPSS